MTKQKMKKQQAMGVGFSKWPMAYDRGKEQEIINWWQQEVVVTLEKHS